MNPGNPFGTPMSYSGGPSRLPMPRNQPTVPFSSPSTPPPTGANGIASAFQGVNPARAGYDVGNAAIMANQQQQPGFMSGWGNQDQAPAQYMRGMLDGLRGQPPVYGGQQTYGQQTYGQSGGQGYNPFATFNQDPARFAGGGSVASKYKNLPGMMGRNPAIMQAMRNEDLRQQAEANQQNASLTQGIGMMNGVIPAPPQQTQQTQQAQQANDTGGAAQYANLPGMMGNNPAIMQAMRNEDLRNAAIANNAAAMAALAAKVESGDIVNTPYGYMPLAEATRRGYDPASVAATELARQRAAEMTAQRIADFNAAYEAKLAANPFVPTVDASDTAGFESARPYTPRPSPFSTLPPLRDRGARHGGVNPAVATTPAPAASAPASVAATPSSAGGSGVTDYRKMASDFRDNLPRFNRPQPAQPQTTPSRPQAGAFGGFGTRPTGGIASLGPAFARFGR